MINALKKFPWFEVILIVGLAVALIDQAADERDVGDVGIARRRRRRRRRRRDDAAALTPQNLFNVFPAHRAGGSFRARYAFSDDESLHDSPDVVLVDRRRLAAAEHEAFDAILREHVTPDGLVDYAAIKEHDATKLAAYLQQPRQDRYPEASARRATRSLHQPVQRHDDPGGHRASARRLLAGRRTISASSNSRSFAWRTATISR